MAVTGGGALTGGEKLLPPVGLMLFSVGDGETDDVVDVVVVVVLDGAGDSLLLQPAVSAPMTTIALPPATSASRRAKRPDFMISSNLNPRKGPTAACEQSVEQR
jgi:hypothetical protein